ncbi:MAG: MCE family protein [Elusimicrobia bacterium]|nr:MCE family protein [Elusimicrobiota bacterium]
MPDKLKVGFFVLVGAVVFGVVVLVLGKISLKPGYTFKVVFDDISGLTYDSPVRIAGVKVGKVKNFQITPEGKAVVTLWIERKYKIYRNCEIRVFSTGVIGTKYLQISQGSPSAPAIKSGDTVKGISSATIEDILESFKAGTGGEPIGVLVTKILQNIKSLTEKLDWAVEDKEDIRGVMSDMRKFARNMRKFSDMLAGNSGDVSEAVAEFPDMVEQAKMAFKKIAELSDKIASSEGAVGKLINDKEVAGEVHQTILNLKEATSSAKKVLSRMSGFKTYWRYSLRHNSEDGKYRSDLGIKIAPRRDKFYYLGISNIKEKNGSDYDAGNQKIDSFDAYLGRKFGLFTIYGGLIRSSGGLGVSAKMMKSLEFTSQINRFDRHTSSGAKPWLDIGAQVRFANWLYANFGVSDILERKDFEMSLKLYYDDEDLPYLFGLGSVAASMSK